VDLVVFDVDGTLTATNEVDTRCFAWAFIEEFATPIDTAWETYPHRTDSGIIRDNFFQRFGRAAIPAELLRFQARFILLLEREWHNQPAAFAEVAGAATAFARLKREQRWALAIASGGWQVSARFKLAKAGIAAAGIPAAFADDAEAREDIVRTAIARARDHYACSFDRIVLVGDSDCDVAAAKRLEIPFVGIAAGDDAVLRSAGAMQIVGDYTEYDAFVEALDRASASPYRMREG
jgi:phosphoglycolate phosphatase-like HAD superfamily hydrolase